MNLARDLRTHAEHWKDLVKWWVSNLKLIDSKKTWRFVLQDEHAWPKKLFYLHFISKMFSRRLPGGMGKIHQKGSAETCQKCLENISLKSIHIQFKPIQQCKHHLLSKKRRMPAQSASSQAEPLLLAIMSKEAKSSSWRIQDPAKMTTPNIGQKKHGGFYKLTVVLFRGSLMRNSWKPFPHQKWRGETGSKLWRLESGPAIGMGSSNAENTNSRQKTLAFLP